LVGDTTVPARAAALSSLDLSEAFADKLRPVALARTGRLT
jgi:hypothetical protein